MMKKDQIEVHLLNLARATESAKEAVDVIDGVNSLDDLLHSLGYALQQASLDDLRRSDEPDAKELYVQTFAVVMQLLTTMGTHMTFPFNPATQQKLIDHMNLLHDLGEDQTILLP